MFSREIRLSRLSYSSGEKSSRSRRSRKVSETQAVILDENSYRQELEAGTVLFIGTGVEKFQRICPHPNATFRECPPLATAMVQPALAALQKKEFKDVAYFEPFYLKEFVAGISRKSVL